MSACYTQVKPDCGETSTWQRDMLVAEVGPTNLMAIFRHALSHKYSRERDRAVPLIEEGSPPCISTQSLDFMSLWVSLFMSIELFH